MQGESTTANGGGGGGGGGVGPPLPIPPIPIPPIPSPPIPSPDDGDGGTSTGSTATTTATATDDDVLSLSGRGLRDEDFFVLHQDQNHNQQQKKKQPPFPLFPRTLTKLDLSRNSLVGVPSPVLRLAELRVLDISRNGIRSLPPGLCRSLASLVELRAASNRLKISTIPPASEFASSTMKNLKLLDFRYNPKMKRSAHELLTSALASSSVEVRCTFPPDPSDKNSTSMKKEKEEEKLSACDRDPNELRSQLEPLSTPQLRKRLGRTFGVDTSRMLDEDEITGELVYGREQIMDLLLACYAEAEASNGRGGLEPFRTVRYERGVPVRKETLDGLLREMEAVSWPHTTRERPKVKAEYYMILQRPGTGQSDSAKTRREAVKLDRYRILYDRAVLALEEVDPLFASQFTALAVTKNFVGSPHIDTLNVGPFYGLSLGDFYGVGNDDDGAGGGGGGGKIAVECTPTIVAEVDTKGRLAKVDGRFPHWVTPYQGTRYSLIYYVTSGEVVPQTTAIFEPPVPVPMPRSSSSSSGMTSSTGTTTAPADAIDETPWIAPLPFVP